MRNLKRLLEEIEKNPVERHEPLIEAGALAVLIQSCLELNFKTLRLGKRIGLGTHAEVYEAYPVEVSAPAFALKVEKPSRHAAGYLKKEIEALVRLSDSHVTPQYVGTFSVCVGEVACLAVGIELFEDSLSSIKGFRGSLSPGFIDWLTAQMLTCVFSLHRQGYLHRDIKPSNFMYKPSADGIRVALVDFGSSSAIGTRNETPFRGTGAYSGINSDPLESKPVDDYWSTFFSVLDLAIEGGLPWRHISARSEEGRTEIFKQKKDLLASIFEGKHSSSVSELVATSLALLYQSTPESFETQFNHMLSDSPIEIDQQSVMKQLRPSHCWKMELPRELKKLQAHSILLSGKNREAVASISSRCFPFPPLDNTALHQGVLSILSAVGQQSSDKQQGDEFVCLYELRGRECRVNRCPLRHIPGAGIHKSGILRWLRRNPICLEPTIDGKKCRNTSCKCLHFPSEKILSIFDINFSPPS